MVRPDRKDHTMPPPPFAKCSHKGFWTVIVLLGVLLAFSVLANTGLLAALALHKTGPGSEDEAVDEFPSFTEEWSCGTGDVKAVRIALDGIIMRWSEAGLLAPPTDMITDILAQIRAARNDEAVQAVIMEMDSPGGEVTASDEIYDALLDFRDSTTGRVVVVHMRDMAASGAYYIAMAADHLVAEPTSIVGSIGVLIETLNWKDLAEKIGVHDTTIKSGENKDMLNPFREVNPAQVALLQELVDSMYRRFKDLVLENRGFAEEDLAELADGRIFTADQALEKGLIDEIGYWDDAVAATAELLGQESVKIVRYTQPPAFLDWLLQVRAPAPLPALRHASAPRLMYLWRP
jgi:protease IV